QRRLGRGVDGRQLGGPRRQRIRDGGLDGWHQRNREGREQHGWRRRERSGRNERSRRDERSGRPRWWRGNERTCGPRWWDRRRRWRGPWGRRRPWTRRRGRDDRIRGQRRRE